MNPWHFSYRVVAVTRDVDGKVIEEHDIVKPYDEKDYSNPNIRALSNPNVIRPKGGELKVVSNVLSQQFTEWYPDDTDAHTHAMAPERWPGHLRPLFVFFAPQASKIPIMMRVMPSGLHCCRPFPPLDGDL